MGKLANCGISGVKTSGSVSVSVSVLFMQWHTNTTTSTTMRLLAVAGQKSHRCSSSLFSCTREKCQLNLS